MICRVALVDPLLPDSCSYKWSAVIFYAQPIFLSVQATWPLSAHVLTPMFFCLPPCYEHLYSLPVASAPAFLAHLLKHDRPNPLLSPYLLHLALIVWKNNLHVCDEEIIDILPPEHFTVVSHRGNLLSTLFSRLSFFFFFSLIVWQNDNSLSAFKSDQSGCLLKMQMWGFVRTGEDLQTQDFRSNIFHC